MHKHTKLTPTLRKEVYAMWSTGRHSFRSLARSYHVDKNVIGKAVLRGRLGDFSVHDSTNRRYRTIEYGLRRLAKAGDLVQKRLDRQNVRRYEHAIPGEMVHGDTKRLRNVWIKGVPPRPKQEVLFVSIDDCTRWLVADILPDKTMWSSSVFLESTLLRLPFTAECYYTDNGGEYRGAHDHAFAAGCVRFGIEQRFTKPKHPWTNGKAERVIKTLVHEWLKKHTFASHEERRASLYAFVDWYNHERPHMGLKGLTPAQKLASILAPSGDNAC